MTWYDKEGKTNPTKEGEYQYPGQPGTGEGATYNPGLSVEESKEKLESSDEVFEWFRYEDGSYGVTSEDEAPEGAKFVKDIFDFRDAVAAGTDFTTNTFTSAEDVAAESTDPTGTNKTPDKTPESETKKGSDPLRQLPVGAKIVKVDNQYRAILELSDGLGAIWYDITDTQYINLGNPEPDETHNEQDFEHKYGSFYFGNINEIEVNGDIAWSQMTKSIFAEFGKYIPLDSPELKRLVMQAYLEGWDSDQVTAEYKTTSYYQNMTSQALGWLDMSTSEQAAEVERTQYKLLAHHIYEFGEAPTEGIGKFKNIATQVSKGEIGLEGSYYSITVESEALEGSSANRRLNDLKSEKNAQLGEADGWYSRILNAHNTYEGNHQGIDESHYKELAQQLATEEKDWNTILNEIQMGSAATHTGKDPILTWNQYSSGAKGSIKDGLELASISNDDPLLTNVLTNELSGKDLDLAIRNDGRYLNTKRAEGELSGNLSQLGKSLGFTV